MFRSGLVAVLALATVACGTRGASEPELSPEEGRLHGEIHALEARRHAGTERLLELTGHRHPRIRARAALALGRVADPDAHPRLLELAGDAAAEVRDNAIWSLGISGEESLAPRLAALWNDDLHVSTKVRLLRALGRIGGAGQLGVIASGLRERDVEVREAAGLAAGQMGRREVPFDDALRRELLGASAASVRARYAVTYALAKEHEPPPGSNAAAVELLAETTRHRDDEVRTTAVAGLAARPDVPIERFEFAATDVVWRVRVPAMKALAEHSREGRAMAADRLRAEWTRLDEGDVTAVHVLATGLSALRPSAKEDEVAELAGDLAARAAARLAEHEAEGSILIAVSHVHCLAGALQVAAGESIERVVQCGGKSRSGWPRHERLKLAAGLLSGGDALETWRELHADPDPRVRAAALERIPELEWDAVFTDALARGLASDEIEVAGTAAAAIATLEQRPAELERALIERARAGAGDVELALTFLTAIADGSIEAGRPVCAASLGDPNRAVREVARACVAALGDDPGPHAPTAEPELPPVERGAEPLVRWHLETTAGLIVIELQGWLAPWHYRAIVKLTRDGLYDGRLWHRVVPGFVVQGGAPGDSAWGGPGFVLPGEPSSAPFTRGAVGIADAGPDTGGSQIFIMHARAAHLESRYTFIGRVTRGMSVVDRLQVGDRIIRATLKGPGVTPK